MRVISTVTRPNADPSDFEPVRATATLRAVGLSSLSPRSLPDLRAPHDRPPRNRSGWGGLTGAGSGIRIRRTRRPALAKSRKDAENHAMRAAMSRRKLLWQIGLENESWRRKPLPAQEGVSEISSLGWPTSPQLFSPRSN